MAHVEKLTAGAMNGLDRHCSRKNNNYKNKMIDPEKTHLNYALDNNENPLEYFKQRMGEVRINQRRDDIKVAASWVVTQPRDVTPEDSRKFFQAAHNFLSEKYGEKNIIWSRVHMDESTPHLHFCFMPVTPDKKHEGQEKLCAKDVLNRADLQRFHGELSAAMARAFGRDIGIETGKTEKNLPLETLKVKTAIDAVAGELDTKKKELDAVLANRKTFTDGRKLAQKLHDEHKPGLVGKNTKIDADLLQQGIDYIWNSGGKDDEIARLGDELKATKAAARAAQEQAEKTEQQRAFLSRDNSELRTKKNEAEREKTKLEKVVAAVEKIAPDVLKQAIAHVRDRDRGRGGYSR